MVDVDLGRCRLKSIFYSLKNGACVDLSQCRLMSFTTVSFKTQHDLFIVLRTFLAITKMGWQSPVLLEKILTNPNTNFVILPELLELLERSGFGRSLESFDSLYNPS